VAQGFFKLKLSYAQEAAGLGIFMLAACLGAAALEAPGSVLHRALTDPFLRRVIMGLLMGLTACCLIYSPMGRNSGAHYNPAVTFCFWRLKKIGGRDAMAYVVAQCIGGLLGVCLAWLLLGSSLTLPQVHFIVTRPGHWGFGAAFVAELTETFVLMSAILLSLNNARSRPYTGLIAAAILSAEVALFSPLSGTSLNPARTLASALPSGDFTGWWIYLTAPILGMSLATEMVRRFLRWEHHGKGL
jgi:aquaporin Z